MKTANYLTLEVGTFEHFVAERTLTRSGQRDMMHPTYSDMGIIELMDKYQREVNNKYARQIFEYQKANPQFLTTQS